MTTQAVRKQLTRTVKDKKAKTDKDGKPIFKDGEQQFDHFTRLEFASEVAKRLDVTRRTVRKARQGLLPALERIQKCRFMIRMSTVVKESKNAGS